MQLIKIGFDIIFDTDRCFAHKRTFTLFASLNILLLEMFTLAFFKVIDVDNLITADMGKLAAVSILAIFLITDIAYFLNDYTFREKPVFKAFLALVTSVKVDAVVIVGIVYPVLIKSENEYRGTIFVGIAAVTFLISFIIFYRSRNVDLSTALSLYGLIFDGIIRKILDGIKNIRNKSGGRTVISPEYAHSMNIFEAKEDKEMQEKRKESARNILELMKEGAISDEDITEMYKKGIISDETMREWKYYNKEIKNGGH